MTRRTFLRSTGAWAAWLAAEKCLVGWGLKPDRRPNIVLFMAETPEGMR